MAGVEIQVLSAGVCYVQPGGDAALGDVPGVELFTDSNLKLKVKNSHLLRLWAAWSGAQPLESGDVLITHTALAALVAVFVPFSGEEVHLIDPMQWLLSIDALQRVVGAVDGCAVDFTQDDDEDVVLDAIQAAAGDMGVGLTSADWCPLKRVKIPEDSIANISMDLFLGAAARPPGRSGSRRARASDFTCGRDYAVFLLCSGATGLGLPSARFRNGAGNNAVARMAARVTGAPGASLADFADALARHRTALPASMRRRPITIAAARAELLACDDMLRGNPEARARLIAARAELVALRDGLDPLARFVNGMTAEEASFAVPAVLSALDVSSASFSVVSLALVSDALQPYLSEYRDKPSGDRARAVIQAARKMTQLRTEASELRADGAGGGGDGSAAEPAGGGPKSLPAAMAANIAAIFQVPGSVAQLCAEANAAPDGPGDPSTTLSLLAATNCYSAVLAGAGPVARLPLALHESAPLVAAAAQLGLASRLLFLLRVALGGEDQLELSKNPPDVGGFVRPLDNVPQLPAHGAVPDKERVLEVLTKMNARQFASLTLADLVLFVSRIHAARTVRLPVVGQSLAGLPNGLVLLERSVSPVLYALGIDPAPLTVFLDALTAFLVDNPDATRAADQVLLQVFQELGEASANVASKFVTGQLAALVSNSAARAELDDMVASAQTALNNRKTNERTAQQSGVAGGGPGAAGGSPAAPSAGAAGGAAGGGGSTAVGGGGGASGVTMIVPRWQAVSGTRSSGYKVDPDYYVFKGVHFKRAALDKKLKAYGLTADSVCMSFLLSGPPTASSGAYAGKVDPREALKFAFIDPVAPVDIVLPHPDWFNAKMAKAAFSAAATKKAGTTVPPFFV